MYFLAAWMEPTRNKSHMLQRIELIFTPWIAQARHGSCAHGTKKYGNLDYFQRPVSTTKYAFASLGNFFVSTLLLDVRMRPFVGRGPWQVVSCVVVV